MNNTDPDARTQETQYDYRLAPYDCLTIQAKPRQPGATWYKYMPRRYDEDDAQHVLDLLYSTGGEKMVTP